MILTISNTAITTIRLSERINASRGPKYVNIPIGMRRALTDPESLVRFKNAPERSRIDNKRNRNGK